MVNTEKGGRNMLPLLTKYVVENNKRVLFGAGALLCVMALLGFLCGAFMNHSRLYFIFSFMLGIMGLVGASQMFSEMKTKEGRISTLMTPATAFQKFMVRWIIWVPCTIIALVVAFEFGELFRYIGCHLFDNDFVPLGFVEFRLWCGHIVLISISTFLAIQSFFVLGAILWPKLSLIKTIVAMWALQTVFGVLLTAGIYLAESNLKLINVVGINGFDLSENEGIAIYTAVGLIISLINWSLAYLRLKESDAI